MEVPAATYRVQLNREFGFEKLEGILPYLSRLGVSHIYSSPIMQASPGSTHCYDVTDPDRINDDLGGAEGFKSLSEAVSDYGMGWVQDIVPNHMAYSTGNKLISGLMKGGRGSDCNEFFDIEWDHPSGRFAGRVLAPFLQEDYRESLKRGELKLVYDDGFAVRYRGMDFPLMLDTYGRICGAGDTQQALDRYNSDKKLLDELLRAQVYDLEHWRTAFEEINYRRFFDIVGMICLHAEKEAVFERMHRLIFKIVGDGPISGLRIDHIDGLHDPEEYLRRVRERIPGAYMVVEKILTGDEELPDTWPVQGTTGYDFIRAVNGLFVDGRNEAAFDALYREFAGAGQGYEDTIYACKKGVIRRQFAGEAKNLARMLSETLEEDGRQYPVPNLVEAVVELLSSFPVYRDYVSSRNRDGSHAGAFEAALAEAKRRNNDLADEFSAIEGLLGHIQKSEKALRWIMRVQQYTGVVMAKGFEDTLFYVYNRFISLNEVGGAPGSFGMPEGGFHAFNGMRSSKWPLSMSPTATHDTKRGEDVRARLNVLSELPSEFKTRVERWRELNRQIKEGGAPNGNEEYYIYQTMIGAFPCNTKDLGGFTARMRMHMVKALREAKINSSWLKPNERYEQAVSSFLTKMLAEGSDFLNDFRPFQKKIAFHGFFNSLSQTLLKITCPGIPDFYQGTELWDLSLVDPDNRRAVDFAERERLLGEVQSAKAAELTNNLEDGRVKLYEINKGLTARSGRRELFERGDYIPLRVKGRFEYNVVAFCRKNGIDYSITVVPRFTTNLFSEGNPFSNLWEDTRVCLPEGTPEELHEAFTGTDMHIANGEARVEDLMSGFPVALLLSDKNGVGCNV